MSLLERTPLVGREGELRTVAGCLEKVARGRGGTLLISGDPGVGKSRLVFEARRLSAEHGFAAFEGACFESDRSVPFAPVSDLLRTFLAGAPSGSDGSGLASLPDLRAFLPELASAPAQPAGAFEKRRLVHALGDFLAARSAVSPLFVVFEDVHWSDDISLEAFLALARRSEHLPILLVLTYRPDEADEDLTRLLGELHRTRMAREIALEPLSVAETADVVRSLAGGDGPVRREVTAAIHELTEGNPFFVEEIVKSLGPLSPSLRDGGHGIPLPVAVIQPPRSVKDAVRRRLQRLSPPARHVASVAAVAGRRFDFRLLQEITESTEPELLAHVGEMIEAHIVVEESSERFAFRHALTQRAIESALLARERRAIHGQIAASLARRPAPVEDADLALHWSAAEEWAKAEPYARAAGHRSLAMYAPRAAAEHFSCAIEALSNLQVEPDAGLFQARGRAFDILGDFDRAHSDYERAAGLARASRDGDAEWRALLDLGFLWAGRDYARARGCFDEALALARTRGDPLKIAHSLNRLGNWLVNAQRPGEGAQLHEEALRIVDALPEKEPLAETLDLLGMATFQRGDALGAARYYDRAIALFSETGERLGLASSFAVAALCGGSALSETDVPSPIGYARQNEYIDESLRISHETGWRAGEAFANAVRGWVAALYGDFGAALPAAEASIATAQGIEHIQWMTAGESALGLLYARLLLLDEARPHLERAWTLANELASDLWLMNVAGFLATVCIEQDDQARAAEVLASADRVNGEAKTLHRRTTILAHGKLALVSGNAAKAAGIVETLLRSAVNAGGVPIPHLAHFHGTVLFAMNRWPAAEAAFQEALAGAAAAGYRPLQWQATVSLAHLYRAQNRQAEAGQATRSASELAGAFALEIPEDARLAGGGSLREAYLEHAAAALPPAQRQTPLRAARDAYGGLTSREREVAVLIARGLSNKEIANELILGERTVEAHVTHILEKLQMHSRTQVAAWAVQVGLLAPAAVPGDR